MKWYMVTKKIGERSYLYRQRTYREGGKVRTQSQYVGAAGEHALSRPDVGNIEVNSTRSKTTEFPKLSKTPNGQIGLTDQQREEIDRLVNDQGWVPGQSVINWPEEPIQFWPNENQLKTDQIRLRVRRDAVSIPAIRGEHGRLSKRLRGLGLSEEFLPTIKLLEGKKAGWKRTKTGYSVILAANKCGSGRNRFKRDCRLALAHAYLDAIERQSPSHYDAIRTAVDRSWFNTKFLVTMHILSGTSLTKKDPKRVWVAMQYLWSGSLPRSVEKGLGQSGVEKLGWTGPVGWRDEAVDVIADVIQRGEKGARQRYAKDRAKAKTNAKRALTAYRKLNPLQRLTSKGRNKWQTYKKHETAFLLAHHKQSRLKMLTPFLNDTSKRRT